jgi:NTP pyrophosphatase (non-canonical NTP hydrolase)
MTNLRPAVRAFAELMEQVLRDNDHKGGWEDEAASRLLDRLTQEVTEVREVLRRHDLPGPEWQRRVAREAADVANYAMMIADVIGGLPARTP